MAKASNLMVGKVWPCFCISPLWAVPFQEETLNGFGQFFSPILLKKRLIFPTLP